MRGRRVLLKLLFGRGCWEVDARYKFLRRRESAADLPQCDFPGGQIPPPQRVDGCNSASYVGAVYWIGHVRPSLTRGGCGLRSEILVSPQSSDGANFQGTNAAPRTWPAPTPRSRFPLGWHFQGSLDSVRQIQGARISAGEMGGEKFRPSRLCTLPVKKFKNGGIRAWADRIETGNDKPVMGSDERRLPVTVARKSRVLSPPATPAGGPPLAPAVSP